MVELIGFVCSLDTVQIPSRRERDTNADVGTGFVASWRPKTENGLILVQNYPFFLYGICPSTGFDRYPSCTMVSSGVEV